MKEEEKKKLAFAQPNYIVFHCSMTVSLALSANIAISGFMDDVFIMCFVCARNYVYDACVSLCVRGSVSVCMCVCILYVHMRNVWCEGTFRFVQAIFESLIFFFLLTPHWWRRTNWILCNFAILQFFFLLDRWDTRTHFNIKRRCATLTRWINLVKCYTTSESSNHFEWMIKFY